MLSLGSVVLKKQKNDADLFIKQEKREYCFSCNRQIATVSTTLYEIRDKHYCAECYTQTIISEAADRDHSDLKQVRKR
jgi:predicted RNA-binding Zn-ribbon protein involved in translation (DUF1610 family)